LKSLTFKLSAIALSVALVGCSNDDNEKVDEVAAERAPYSAQIKYTSFGVPHITADTYGSLGYGVAHAQMKDNMCTLSEQLMKLKGLKSLYLGPGTANENLASDIGYQALDLSGQAVAAWDDISPQAQQVLEGYAKGFNDSLAKRGSSANYPTPCVGAPWVTEIEATDLLAYTMDISLLASGRRLIPAVAAAAPPVTDNVNNSVKGAAQYAKLDVQLDPELVLKNQGIGSNGWGIGATRSESGNALLMANPHFPWDGELRFFENHLTIPGELDVTGVTFAGLPGVLVGFNKDVAWTHTVSQAKHFTLYQLTLDPADATRYMFDGKSIAMTTKDVSVEVAIGGGETMTVPKTVYYSHFGPMVDMSSISSFLGWSETSAITYRDANAGNSQILDQWLAINRATSTEDITTKFKEIQGNPWVNTIMVDKTGKATYIDATNVPAFSAATESYVKAAIKKQPVASLWMHGGGSLMLPGNTSAHEWLEYESSVTPGLRSVAAAPKQVRDDYVFNANSSHWLTNVSKPLEGYSIIYGPERTERSTRTRHNAQLISDMSGMGVAGEDNLFSLTELRDTITDNRSLFSGKLRGQLVALCEKTPIVTVGDQDLDLTPACGVLKAWDGYYNVDSRGAHLMREFLQAYRWSSHTNLAPSLFKTSFDADNPATTPTDLNPDNALKAFAGAVVRLMTNGIALDSALGDIQYVIKNDIYIAVTGGYSFEGVMNMAETARPSASSSVFETLPIGEQQEGTQLSLLDGESAYRINYGTSFAMALEMTPQGPQAQAILTFSQSHDPQSMHFDDQTKMYAEKTWRPVLFNQADIDKDLKETVAVAE